MVRSTNSRKQFTKSVNKRIFTWNWSFAIFIFTGKNCQKQLFCNRSVRLCKYYLISRKNLQLFLSWIRFTQYRTMWKFENFFVTQILPYSLKSNFEILCHFCSFKDSECCFWVFGKYQPSKNCKISLKSNFICSKMPKWTCGILKNDFT